MAVRTQVTLDPDTQRRARAKATELGISFAEYVRRLVASDLGERRPKADISILFDLVDEGPPTDIAHDKDKMTGEGVWKEHRRKAGSKPSRRRRAKTGS